MRFSVKLWTSVIMATKFRVPEKAGSFSISWSRKKPYRGVGLHLDLPHTLCSFRPEVTACRAAGFHTFGGVTTFIAAWVSNPCCSVMRAVSQKHTEPSGLQGMLSWRVQLPQSRLGGGGDISHSDAYTTDLKHLKTASLHPICCIIHVLTFKNRAVSLRTTRCSIQKFYTALALL